MKKIIAISRGYRRPLALLTVGSALSAAMEAATLIALVPLASAIASQKDAYAVHVAGVNLSASVTELFTLVVGLILGRMLVQSGDAYLQALIVANYEADQKRELFEAFMDADWALQAKDRGGELQDLMTSFVAYAMNAIDNLCGTILALFSLAMMVLAALLIEPLVAASILAMVCLLFIVMRPLARMARRYSSGHAAISLEHVHAVHEDLSVVREIRVFNVANEVKTRMLDVVLRGERARMSRTLLATLVPALYQSIAMLLVIAGLGGVYLIGVRNFASLAAIVLLLIRALSYSQTLQAYYHRFADIGPYSEAIGARLAEFRAATTVDEGRPLGRIEGLGFNGVTFAYPGGDPVLRDVSFEARRGEIIGIVGPSGAGKSTFVQLLLRLRSPDAGVVLVNNEPAEAYAKKSWYQRVGFVPQEPVLVNASVAENIRFFRPGVDLDALVHAAEQAHIHDEVISWPGSYDTLVGERGAEVSGGQRQRICIARALIGQPDVLIFDEPTSSVDVKSELLIQRTFEEVRGHVLLFIVAHRLSTLNICDRVMVFNDGRLQAFGPQAELATNNSYFSQAMKLSRLS